jgi:ATP-dependent Lon protease
MYSNICFKYSGKYKYILCMYMENKKNFLVLLSKIREKFDYLNKFNNELQFIYNGICSIMSNLNDQNISKEVIEQEKYNEYIEKVEQIFNKFRELDPPLRLSIFREKTIMDLRIFIITIKDQLYKICECTGASSCSDVLSILSMNNNWKDSINNDKYNKLLNFYDKFFIPISSKCIKSYKDTRELLSITKVEKHELPFPKKIETRSKTLIEKVDGATIYFPFRSKIIQINGIFKKDPINVTRYGGTFGQKCILLNNDLSYIDIPDDFKKKIVEQLSLRDFIVLNIREIIQSIKRSYDELLKYKKKTLSSLIKEFVKSSPEKQLKIITLFLMSDNEDQFNAHVVFDLIANKSLLFQSKPYAQQIFNSLHWSIQKYFKVVLKNIQEKKRQLESLTSEDIPYETRIVSLKTTDSVKTKALTKLKEMNGTKENANKARQFLDGLLRIPFGIYHEEEIFCIYRNFNDKLENFVTILQCKLNEFDENNLEVSNEINNIFSEIINNYHTNENSENKINKYMKFLGSSIRQLLAYASVAELDLSTISDEVLQKFSLSKETIYNLIPEKIVEPKKKLTSDEIIEQILKNNKKELGFYKECKKKLEHYKSVKDTLVKNDSLTNNHITMIKNKLAEVEEELGIIEENDDEEDDEMDYNIKDFINYFVKESLILIQEWQESKTKKSDYLNQIENVLNKSVHGHNESKQHIKRIIGQWMNGQMKGQSFGLCGPPGVGKTTICKNGLAKCLVNESGKTRPFAFLGLGGSSNGSVLEGHNYTYLGSTWGKIVDILIETKCMNPIIYIDELDKVSKTEHGREIIGILTHLTDPVQNKEFQDKYFAGIPIDLSRVLFVFSYNDSGNIDRILRDRIQEIDVKPLSKNEKIVISKKYVLPDIFKTVGFSKDEIYISKSQVSNIIDQYTYESGVRKLNEILFDIVRELNLKKIMDEDIDFPMKLTDEFINDIMKNKPKITFQKIAKKSQIGLVSGLYCTGAGIGGILPIYVSRTVTSNKKFNLERHTGLLQNTIEESIHIATTLALNLVPKEILNNSDDDLYRGLHIHCGDGSTKKSGPSAGSALCLGVVSRVCNIPVKNTVALTSEITLNGICMQIGGLHSKLSGALRAGVKTVMIPYDNKEDYERIINNDDDIDLMSSQEFSDDENTEIKPKSRKKKINKNKTIKNDLKVIFVKDIYDVLKHGLVKNDIKFNKIF